MGSRDPAPESPGTTEDERPEGVRHRDKPPTRAPTSDKRFKRAVERCGEGRPLYHYYHYCFYYYYYYYYYC